MAIERRLRTRHGACTTVYVMLPGQQRHMCSVRNLSVGGAFVETGDLALHKGQAVELAFAVSRGPVTRLHRRTAVVAHVSGDGTGLHIQDFGR